MIESGSAPWASVTFVGARHRIRLRLPDREADRLCNGLAEREFAIPGHIVADIALVTRHEGGGEAIVEIEALTIEDC